MRELRNNLDNSRGIACIIKSILRAVFDSCTSCRDPKGNYICLIKIIPVYSHREQVSIRMGFADDHAVSGCSGAQWSWVHIISRSSIIILYPGHLRFRRRRPHRLALG